MEMEAVIMISAEASKGEIRLKVWDYIEAKNLANFPRPVHNRIPNFKGAERACANILNLEVFQKAKEVKVDPDKPLEAARLSVLQAGKTLLVPTPRLRSGLLNKIVPPERASGADLRVCSTSQGVKKYSVPIGLDAKVNVDLVVVGSVAVSEKGYRIGKGEGYSDMEYAMMVSVGAVEDPVVITIVHDCQVMDIPENLIENHDLTVDYILTPTRVIRTECKLPKPRGIIWAKLDADMMEKIPILKTLRCLEQEAGKEVTLGRARGRVGGRAGPREDPGRHRKAGEDGTWAWSPRGRDPDAGLAGSAAPGPPGLQRRPAGLGGPVRKRKERTGRAREETGGWQDKGRPDTRTSQDDKRTY